MVWLGTLSGRVIIKYDMKNMPDKLEVFYEKKRIASTFQVHGNVDGFVGGDNPSGADGTLIFDYAHHIDGFIEIVVTAPGAGTSWNYHVSCPLTP